MAILFFIFFSCYFIYFRLFSLGFAHLLINMPRTSVIIILAFVTAVLIKFAPLLFFKKNAVYDFIKSIYSSVNKSIIIFSAVLSGICGPNLILFGIDGIEIAGFAGILAALSGICVSFIFFIILFQSVYNSRDKIISFLKIFIDLKFIAVIAAVNFMAVLYIILSKQVYFWDNAGYWQSAASISGIIFKNPGVFFDNLVKSVFNSDYNNIPAVIPAVIMAVFGTGRLIFILAIINFYFVPFLAFIYMTTKKFADFIIIALFLPMAFYLTIIGFLDVGGIFLSLIILYVFLFGKENYNLDFINGVILCLLILFRRWYIFFAAAFLICVILYAVVLYKTKIKKSVVTLLGFLSSFFVFFQGYFTKRLMAKNYADIYSAYKFSFDTDIKIFLRYFGIALILTITFYIIYCVVKQKQKKEKLINLIFLYVFIVLMFVMFTLIQTHGQQHLLLYVPGFALILFCMTQDFKIKRDKIILAAVSVLCTVSIFLPRVQPQAISEIKTYAPLPSFSVYPIVRNDADELMRLDEYIKTLDGKITVLASSFVINADILAKAEASLNPLKSLKPSENIFTLPAVDKRDGRPYNIAYADYIITASPVQTHLDPQDQQVVVIPALMLMSDTPFSSAFEKTDIIFKLKDGVEVYIYRRLRPNTDEEMNEVWEKINIGD
ncbi:MAG: hypothetical protein FWF92_02920 [Oscillospiraceae bacterium]|nr:hypothetical protein [Oscillospiraceae bacterium]